MGKKTSRGPRKYCAPPSGRPVSATFQVKNELGLHARAAALFVKVASRFRSEISVRRGTNEVNGKSIMGILMLAAAQGSTVQVTARGEDASSAVQELGRLFTQHFGEK